MKNYLPRLVVGSVLLLIGYKPISAMNIFGGSDTYKIQWTGTNGSKLFGSYVIASKTPGTASKVEKVLSTIPYEVTFSAQKNTLVSAAGTAGNQGTVEVKIFKNGSECGQVTMVGSGAIANRTCQ
ncbi:MAG: hypothetical protein ACYTXF_12905 [Nostoc sp.]